MMLVSIVLRLHLPAFGLSGWYAILLSFDPIAAGCLLAILRNNAIVRRVLTSPAFIVLSLTTIFSPLIVWDDFGSTPTYRLMLIPALGAIVLRAYVGFGSWMQGLFTNRVVRFLSKISYGIYIYHFFLWWIAGHFFPMLYTPGAWTFLIMTALTTAVATLSWYGVERHCDRMKVHFPLFGTASVRTEAV